MPLELLDSFYLRNLMELIFTQNITLRNQY
jgi:hypothetical protein